MKFVENYQKRDEFWSSFAEVWFEKGRQDDAVRLLKFTPEEAAVWAFDSSAILVGLRLLRASLTDRKEQPDVGVHHIFTFDEAA